MKTLKNADFFGVPFVQNIDHGQTKYKSTFGGIITITIFSVSLAYVIWIGYLWQTNQMSPKISRQNYISDYSLLDLSQDVIRLYYWKGTEDRIDPFVSNILLPLVMYSKDTELTAPQLIKNHIVDSNVDLYVPDMKFGFTYYEGIIYTSNEMYVEVVLCDEIYLQPGEKCASQELRDQFFAQRGNEVIIEFYSTTIDPRDGKEQRGYQEYYIQIEEQFCYSVAALFKTTLFELQNMLLFGPSQYKEYIVDVSIQTQTNSREYCSNLFETEAIGVVYLAMRGTQEKTVLEYPRLGDLLANVGSIVSILFIMKYFIMFLNEYYLNQKVLKEIISFYYPEFKRIQIKKNWRGKMVDVSLNKVKIDPKNYKKFYEKVSSQMQKKLSYLNLLYEISRMYFVMRSSKFRNEFHKSHQIGIKISLFQQKESEMILTPKSEKYFENNHVLNEDDAEILNYNRTNIVRNYELISEEIYNEMDYYYMNKIS
ncbi:unnamed protein product (macronuclear) [Paramecium tetraurelia]|uniref:Uncharacterized protein n=1 Tax=Paramecium tetraurelia TaxID=5888 RepID=A0C432_PARTE|nr:uncharacterized protein GSPATT00035029001 [Paramecium tetraurelia]CAK65549.1 unnamed protein product [Paramecium tetraurelia]|eukprot:XP_001432946.1 hypothetical protein (macronuclear) [Paramecium tetraurelia strain d4-2]